MANFKGAYQRSSNNSPNSTGFIKQIRDLNFRLAAFGESRYKNTTSKGSHSIATSKKRDEFAKSFAKYIESKYDDLEGKKLNEFFDTHHIKEFLQERTENLSIVSKESYIRSFSSMLQGLSQNNISMNYDTTLFDNMVESLKKENPKPTIETGRAIKDTDTLIKNIAIENYSASIISKVQIEMGYRVSEAVEVVKNFSKYFDNVSNTIKNVSGKAGHIYNPKPITSSLIAKIKLLSGEKIISKRAYQKILSKFEIKSHDFRFTYALNSFNSFVKSGENYNSALLEVSSQLNHKRAGMTRYYLSRK